MHCNEVQDCLGAYVDGEATAAEIAGIEAHVGKCRSCQRELRDLRCLSERLSVRSQCEVPAKLWERISERLATSQHGRAVQRRFSGRSVAAIAACVLLAVGATYVALFRSVDFVPTAKAAPVNFAILLDHLSNDPETAFSRFVALYDGRQVSAADAREHASKLDFEIPDVLPGGFELREAFALKIDGAPAAAARYTRGGELLGAIFHRAIHPEDYGTYRDHPCVIGEHRGHKVKVGDWSLVHVTDPTTCHCVLSRLNPETELPDVLAAVAPRANPNDEGGHHP